MLNPALFAALTASATERYEAADQAAMPASLAFLVAPLVLHRATREALPTRINSHWARWTSSNPILVAGFPARAAELAGPVRDGLRFGLRHNTLVLTGSGGLTGGLPRDARVSGEGDVAEIVRRAGFVGRWLTRLDRPATAFALLGVTP